MKSETETISKIKRNLAKINDVYNEKGESARICFEMAGDEIKLFLDNGWYTVNVFVGTPDDANKLLSFHCTCVRSLEYLF